METSTRKIRGGEEMRFAFSSKGKPKTHLGEETDILRCELK